MIDIKYIDHMGSDLRVVDAARVSFDSTSWWNYQKDQEVIEGKSLTIADEKDLIDQGFKKVIRDKDRGLIHFLARGCRSEDWDKYVNMIKDEEDRDNIEGIITTLRQLPLHFTPFTHCVITMYESVPIIVARQRFKHIVGFTYNEVSRRYVKSRPDLYKPDIWRRAAVDVKQGSSELETVDTVDLPVNSPDGIIYLPASIDAAVDRFYDMAHQLYDAMIKAEVAPEQARIILPQSMMTKYIVTGSLSAWARARNLRNGKDAQKEINSMVSKWDSIISELYPESWAALLKY